MNLGEIRSAVYRRLDSDSTSGRFTTAVLNQLINDGYREAVVRSGVLVGSLRLTPIAGRLFYDLPDDCVRVTRLFRVDVREKVWPVDIERLDHRWPNWQQDSGTRWEWYFVFGLNQIVVGPKFDTVGDEEYELRYELDPGDTALAADTTEPEIPRKWHDALIDYATGRALLYDGAVENLERATLSLGDFQKKTQNMKGEVGKTIDRTWVMRPEDPRFGDPAISLGATF